MRIKAMRPDRYAIGVIPRYGGMLLSMSITGYEAADEDEIKNKNLMGLNLIASGSEKCCVR
jgi:hypothetical protein